MFDSKKLLAHSAPILAQRATIADLQAHHARATTDAQTGDTSAGALTELRQRREKIIGEAYIAKTKADTKTVDAEIARLEKVSVAALEAAQSARHALPVIEEQLAAAHERLRLLQGDQAQDALQQAQAALGARTDAIKTAGAALLALITEADVAARMAAALKKRLDGGLGGEHDLFVVEILNNVTLPTLTNYGWRGLAANIDATLRARPVFEAAEHQLREVGLEVSGSVLKPKPVQHASSSESRPVTITSSAGMVGEFVRSPTITLADDKAPGLVDSVTH